MNIDEILGRLGKFFFFISTLFIVSISLGGILYTDSFSQTLGFNFSLFDLNAYTSFTQVLVSDQYNVFAKGIVITIFIMSFIFVYPKSLLLAYDLLVILVSNIYYVLPSKFFLLLFLVISPFLLPLFFLILVLVSIVLKLREFNCLKKICREINLKLEKNEYYKKSDKRIPSNFPSYIKASFLFVLMALPLQLWGSWILGVGKQGEEHAKIYLKSPNYKTVMLINNTVFNAVLVSKVKGGYLFVLHENGKNNNKATFISDSAILRID